MGMSPADLVVFERVKKAVVASGDQAHTKTLLSLFGDTGFPTTRVFSATARLFADRHPQSEMDPLHDPDRFLDLNFKVEEVLFRSLERHLLRKELVPAAIRRLGAFANLSVEKLVEKAIIAGIEEATDQLPKTTNRRKVRAGYGLENHFEAVLEAWDLSFSRSKVTKNNGRPDFVLPGIKHHRDRGYPTEALTVVAVKASIRDRWPQIVLEEDRNLLVYLLTTDLKIPESQLAKMDSLRVQPVVPVAHHSRLPLAVRKKVISVRELLEIATIRARW